MTPNVGSLDRMLRILVGLVLIACVFVGPQTPWGWVGTSSRCSRASCAFARPIRCWDSIAASGNSSQTTSSGASAQASSGWISIWNVA